MALEISPVKTENIFNMLKFVVSLYQVTNDINKLDMKIWYGIDNLQWTRLTKQSIPLLHQTNMNVWKQKGELQEHTVEFMVKQEQKFDEDKRHEEMNMADIVLLPLYYTFFIYPKRGSTKL